MPNNLLREEEKGDRRGKGKGKEGRRER